MENYIGETENLINAQYAGMMSSIKRQRKELEYRQELEQYLLDIFNDYSLTEVNKMPKSISNAWFIGERLSYRIEF